MEPQGSYTATVTHTGTPTDSTHGYDVVTEGNSYAHPLWRAELVLEPGYGPEPTGWGGRQLEDRPLRGPGLSLGVGSVHRVDPTGFAADAGEQIRAAGRLDLQRLSLHASLMAARAHRQGLSDAPEAATLPSVPDLMRFGRAEASASWALGQSWAASLQAWVERSDRDLPTTGAAPPSGFRTSSGATLALSWGIAGAG